MRKTIVAPLTSIVPSSRDRDSDRETVVSLLIASSSESDSIREVVINLVGSINPSSS